MQRTESAESFFVFVSLVTLLVALSTDLTTYLLFPLAGEDDQKYAFIEAAAGPSWKALGVPCVENSPPNNALKSSDAPDFNVLPAGAQASLFLPALQEPPEALR